MATRSFKVKNGLIIGATTEITSIVDEDNMASDSATALATQQSIKAYVAAQVASADTFLEMSDTPGSYTASALITTNAAGNAVESAELIYTVSSNDITIKNATSDKDIIFSVNDGGSTAELFRLDASESILLMASGKKIGFVDGNEAISGDGTNLTVNSGADINLTCASGDINVPANIGMTFGNDGEKIEGDGTDLTIASSNDLTITTPGTLSLNTTGITTVAGALTVTGDLTINGTTTTNNSVNTTIDDNIIELNSGISSSGNDIGFIFERGSTGDNAAFIWDESTDKFTLGTTTATAADKSGGITVSAGTLTATCSAAQYSDVAERYHADESMSTGTIVALGGANEITKTATELSDEVFGVVSSRDTAAFMMNDPEHYSDLTHPFVAMTGRVPTNVIGTVTKGARLVSSSTPGYARMAQPGEATAFNVVGRALEAKTDSEAGQVLAVVSIKA
jgi:membrane-bound inhibitor of C-type lysozyme